MPLFKDPDPGMSPQLAFAKSSFLLSPLPQRGERFRMRRAKKELLTTNIALTHRYRVIQAWGFIRNYLNYQVLIWFAQNIIEFIDFLCFYAHKSMTILEKTNGFEILLGKINLKHQLLTPQDWGRIL
jgi:hypothetical protein